MEAAKTFFVALYRQQPGASMASARFTMFTKKKKSPKIQALPPTSSNLLLHVLRAHLQVMLWKAADQQDPMNMPISLSSDGDEGPRRPTSYSIPECRASTGVKDSDECRGLSPLSLFTPFFTDYLLGDIVTDTNLYAQQCLAQPPNSL